MKKYLTSIMLGSLCLVGSSFAMTPTAIEMQNLDPKRACSEERQHPYFMHNAAIQGNLAAIQGCVNFWFESDENPVQAFKKLTARDGHGNTPLHLAAQNGHDEVVQYIIDTLAALTNEFPRFISGWGVAPHSMPNNYAKTPLDFALEQKDLAAIEALEATGAKTMRQMRKERRDELRREEEKEKAAQKKRERNRQRALADRDSRRLSAYCDRRYSKFGYPLV